MNFAEYVKTKRKNNGITLRAFADLIGVAPAYLSDIEKEKRNAPTQEILEKMVIFLKLSDEEKNELFDLAAKSKNAVAQDLKEYLCDNQNVRVALRKAKELNFGDEEWVKIIEKMISKK